jgi:hypothetical protein
VPGAARRGRIDGIPAICIDPKGDLGNLLLTFPHLQAAEFLSWIDPGEAQRKGLSTEQYAAQTAETWKKGLAEWGQPPAAHPAISRCRRSRYLHAGLRSGTALVGRALVLGTVGRASAGHRRVARADRDCRLGPAGVADRAANPINSRDHVLLSTIFEDAWRKGTGLDMASLIAAVQKPPVEKVGAFDLETFYPAKGRLQLAMAINNLLASPGFAAWLSGEPLDIQRLAVHSRRQTADRRDSIAHLSDQERMFIVTLLLNEMIAWMRSQSGTSSLRAILYMDEIYGYFPPTANPPSKQPMLTLLKQARAFGLGCVLATQNPVDLDYKGLANAGTWMIGRLQTERDKLRVLEGLESAVPGSDRAALDKMISGLTPRVFLMRNVHDDAPVLFQSRWALSYLRGPLTGVEISKLMAPRRKCAIGTNCRLRLPLPALPRERGRHGWGHTATEHPRGCPRVLPRRHRCWRGTPLQTNGDGHRKAALRRLEARARSMADDGVPRATLRRRRPDCLGRGSGASRPEVATEQSACTLLHVRATSGRRIAHAVVCSVGQSFSRVFVRTRSQ